MLKLLILVPKSLTYLNELGETVKFDGLFAEMLEICVRHTAAY